MDTVQIPTTQDLQRLMLSIEEKLSGFLIDALLTGHIGRDRSFYGASFLKVFLADRGLLGAREQLEIEDIEAKSDIDDPQRHWEFLEYAKLALLESPIGPGNSGGEAEPLRFKGTQVANWAMLRAICRAKRAKRDSDHQELKRAILEAKWTLQEFQDRDGFIQDQRGVRSLQYHAFSTLLLQELIGFDPERNLFEAYSRARNVVRAHILPCGSCVYLGRGQNQLFGYASVIRLLSETPSSEDRLRLGAILRLVSSHQNEEGRLPLVLGSLGSATEGAPDLKSIAYAGWYAYNNYFDYLPFFAHFLHRARVSLSESVESFPERPELDSVIGPTRVRHGKDFSVLVSRPVGVPANWMPQPLVSTTSHRAAPVFGGEEYFPSTFTRQDIPLPVFVFGQLPMARWVRSFWIGSAMVCVSLYGVCIRVFRYSKQEVAMTSFTFPPLFLRDRFAIEVGNSDCEFASEFNRGDIGIKASKLLRKSRLCYSASGAYEIWECSWPWIKIEWRKR